MVDAILFHLEKHKVDVNNMRGHGYYGVAARNGSLSGSQAIVSKEIQLGYMSIVRQVVCILQFRTLFKFLQFLKASVWYRR